MQRNQENVFWESLNDKEKLKKDFILVCYFITVYENFKNNYEREILSFTADSVSYKDKEKPTYKYVIPNPNNPNAIEDNDFIKTEEMPKEIRKEIYGTIKTKKGKNDRTASLFNWLLSQKIIEQQHYDNLLKIRTLRNELVHELDNLLYNGLPNNLAEMLKELLEIRKYASKQWFVSIEMPIQGLDIYDTNGKQIIPEVYDGSNIVYDLIFNTILR